MKKFIAIGLLVLAVLAFAAGASALRTDIGYSYYSDCNPTPDDPCVPTGIFTDIGCYACVVVEYGIM